MPIATTFDEFLEAAESLSVAEQETLIEILSRRLADVRRQELAGTIAEARREFDRGEAEAVSADDLMDELLA